MCEFPDDPGFEQYCARRKAQRREVYDDLQIESLAKLRAAILHNWEMMVNGPECSPGNYFRRCYDCGLTVSKEDAYGFIGHTKIYKT